MDNTSSKPLSPVSFLQAFIVQSVKVAESNDGNVTSDADRYIEQVGLTASHCLEESARTCLGYNGPITSEQYADVIIDIKNRIGGNFSRASSADGTIRVVNSRCPFGDSVHEAPELCRMTASVFGGIAARNFGYGKVELRKRIALNHDCCEVCIYISILTMPGTSPETNIILRAIRLSPVPDPLRCVRASRRDCVKCGAHSRQRLGMVQAWNPGSWRNPALCARRLRRWRSYLRRRPLC